MSNEKPAEVTGAHLGPFLKMRPDAKIQVIVGDLLVAVTDAYYDNESGAIVLELGRDADHELGRTPRALRRD